MLWICPCSFVNYYLSSNTTERYRGHSLVSDFIHTEYSCLSNSKFMPEFFVHVFFVFCFVIIAESKVTLQLFWQIETKLSTAGWTVVGLLLQLCTRIYMMQCNNSVCQWQLSCNSCCGWDCEKSSEWWRGNSLLKNKLILFETTAALTSFIQGSQYCRDKRFICLTEWRRKHAIMPS